METKTTAAADEMNCIELNRFFIDEAYRNKGLGEKTLVLLKQQVKEQGFTGLCCKVYLDNPAQNLYKRMGFKMYYQFMIVK